MIYSLNELYVRMPTNEGRVFELPDTIYSSMQEAMQDKYSDEEVKTLAQAFERIAKDIHEDA